MARLSFLEHHTLQPGGQGQAKPLCLRNPDYARMRKKIDVTFPDQLDAAKVPNSYCAHSVFSTSVLVKTAYCRTVLSTAAVYSDDSVL